MDKKYNKFYKKAKNIYRFEDTGHDFGHIKRCLAFANKIMKAEGGNEFVITVAVLFHDVHRVLSKESYVSAKDSVQYVKKYLEEFNIEPKTLNQILEIISKHEDKDSNKNDSLELTILKDADILDALGKVGLARTLKYCKTKHIPVFSSLRPLDDPDYKPNIFPISTTHYVFRTMIPEVNLIKTETGKGLAKKQIAELEKFVHNNLKKYKNIDGEIFL